MLAGHQIEEDLLDEVELHVDMLADGSCWWWYALTGSTLFVIGANSYAGALDHARQHLQPLQLVGPFRNDYRATNAGLFAYGIAIRRGTRDTRPDPERFCDFCFGALFDSLRCACTKAATVHP